MKSSEERVCMEHPTQYLCPPERLAKSILDVWLSGDRYQLRRELERVSELPASQDFNDGSDRLELLKSIASRMADSSDLFAPRKTNPRVIAWLDLLGHLSGEGPDWA